mmetsp:Transcript_69853/g.146027  ORF Transcript_69853/g.146027 Transcript_69853/m.146027 type:complete len:259 (-) Transcript_69853:15-791(-)
MRFQALGQFVPIAQASRREGSSSTVWAPAYLDVLGIVFVGLLFGATVVKHRVHPQKHGQHVHRCATILQKTIAMTTAWTILFAIHWRFLATLTVMMESHLAAHIILTLGVSLVAAGVVVFVNLGIKCVQNRKLKGLLAIPLAMGFLVGLSWQGTFSRSIEDLSASQALAKKNTFRVGMSIAAFLMTYPAWLWYILPKTDRRLAKFHFEATEDAKDRHLVRVLTRASSSEGGSDDEDDGEEHFARAGYAVDQGSKKRWI